ncbi:Coproporphyrinogen-III oxidase, partial [Xylographa carneopallida]|nr:Coproporphyrinogen-III oxidase [Xylographa carneopallida]
MLGNRSSSAAARRLAATLKPARSGSSAHILACNRRRNIHSSARPGFTSSAHNVAAAASAVLVSAAALAYWSLTDSSADCAAGTSPASASPRPPPGVTEKTTQRTTFIHQLAPLPPSQQTAEIPLEQLALLFAPPDIQLPHSNSTTSDSSTSSSAPAYPAYAYNDFPPLVFTATSPDLHHQWLEGALRRVQDVICQHILNIEAAAPATPNTATQLSASTSQPAAFREDITQRPDGGGIARVMSDGRVFQKAGVNSSFARMRLPFGRLKDMKADHQQLAALIADNDWLRQQQQRSGTVSSGGEGEPRVFGDDEVVERFTASMSLVIHSVNPFVPTVHANYRYFEFFLPDGRRLNWFAGGSDLTPSYVRDSDATYFHSTLKRVCDAYDARYYPTWKRWCDRYFFIKHRQETRGVGGIFMDDLTTNPQTHPHYQSLIHSLAAHFAQSYFPLVLRYHTAP